MKMLVFQTLFWISGILIIYTSIIYYFILKLFQQIHYEKDEDYLPSISLVICAYNEEKRIRKKLENTFNLEYPLEKLQVILADDGSADKTIEIAKTFEFVEVLSLSRGGKTHAQNEAVKKARNEILVFSDANNIYKNDALIKLSRNFADKKVGVVCGELQYHHKQSEENAYWRYEVAIKEAESKHGCLLGANGSIYAVRRDAYISLPIDSISDHLEPILIYGNGLDVIYEPEAIALEDAPDEVLSRKRRIILRSLGSMKYILPLINPFHKRSIFIPYFSHKLIRWFLPFLFLTCFITSLFLSKDNSFFRILIFLQVGFYSLGLIHSGIRYIIKVNIASAMAIVDWVLGKKQTTWNVIR
jgi:cellulose synthase/poly-beta-1,6-N-acetylglucosamine synthase-like glycosyltransferase